MPFWQPQGRGSTHDVDYVDQTAHLVKQDLAAGVDPRASLAVDLMLQWLWRLDSAKVKAMHKLLAAPGIDATDYGRFLYALPIKGEAPVAEPPHSVVTGVLREFLVHRLYPEQTPLHQDRESIHPEPIIVENGLAMIARLRMIGAHDVVCRILFAANFKFQTRKPDTSARSLAEVRQMIRAAEECLLALPPDEIPAFWSQLKLPSTAHDLLSVAARMRDRRAVPFLIDALPCLDVDGRSNVVVALGNIKDVRAVPALQEIAADRTSLVAPIAAQALAEILRESRDDAAMLLRATDSRHAGKAAETLLRPAAGAPDAQMRPDQLLRAGDRPSDEKKQ
jgi:hypothetical protein